MKILCFSLFLICACVFPTQAQVGTPKYQFKNRAEAEVAARKNKLNLRESYNIIMCAKRQGMIKSVVRVYEQEVGNPFDTPPQLASSFALAHHLLTDPVRWDFKQDTASNLTSLSQSDGIRITNYREQALKKLPNSPEVLLGYAIWAKDQFKREQALNLVQKALRSSPDWADLNWWHAQLLGLRLSSLPQTQRQQESVRYGVLQLRALDKAELLDPYFKRENLSSRAYAYYDAHRYNESLRAFDDYNRQRPEFKRYLGETGYQQWRNALLSATKRIGAS